MGILDAMFSGVRLSEAQTEILYAGVLDTHHSLKLVGIQDTRHMLRYCIGGHPGHLSHAEILYAGILDTCHMLRYCSADYIGPNSSIILQVQSYGPVWSGRPGCPC
ncbi:hypothetical protein BS17DRAFT_767580 [Gyrodon lividus]|nr:hypothetical protein BS17DRAFT_767580 [Gyrodon lividus]